MATDPNSRFSQLSSASTVISTEQEHINMLLQCGDRATLHRKLADFRIPQLNSICSCLCLPRTGNKPELIRSIATNLFSQSSTSVALTPSVNLSNSSPIQPTMASQFQQRRLPGRVDRDDRDFVPGDLEDDDDDDMESPLILKEFKTVTLL